jgi:putative PIN family toxin of toxin-antitoxin system
VRLVLDSNVWLDWLFFDDPGVTALKTAQQRGAIEIIIDAPCRDELVRVLDYERFALDSTAQTALIGEVDRLSRRLENLCYQPPAALPWCPDPDDVKFLALAAAGNADWLITKDKALLGRPRQRRRTAIAYRIATPQQWSLSQSSSCRTASHC